MFESFVSTISEILTVLDTPRTLSGPRVRPSWSQRCLRVDQRVFIQPKQLADGGCGTERALHGRIMKSAFRFDDHARALDPAANLASENQRSQKRLATQVVTSAIAMIAGTTFDAA